MRSPRRSYGGPGAAASVANTRVDVPIPQFEMRQRPVGCGEDATKPRLPVSSKQVEENPVTLIALPLGLAFIMVTLGLSLTAGDFRRVFTAPRGVIIGMANLLFLAPLLAFGVAEIFNLSPVLAVGLVLLGAAPGGTMANLLTHLAKGETALSVSLTGISSAMAVVTVPVYLSVSSSHFGLTGADNDVNMIPIAARVLLITLLPLGIGMMIRARNPEWAVRMEPKLKRVALVLFALIVAGAIASEWDIVTGYLDTILLATIALNVSAMTFSWFISRGARLDERASTAIALELGLHNATLAIAVGAAVDAEMTVPAAIYGIFMWFTGGPFAWFMSKRNARTEPIAA